MQILKYALLMLILFSMAVFAEDGDQEAEEAPSVAVTMWTEKMELFMEYPILTVNQPGKFIIHLTIINGFQPIREGEVKLVFTSSDGHSQEVTKNELLREGIFTPMIEINIEGNYTFDLTYTSSQISDTFNIEGFVVYSSIEDIPNHEEVPIADEVVFLKEQQWKIPFSTTMVENREIKNSVWAIGEVLPSSDAYVEIISPVEGIIHVGHDRNIALPGSTIKRNDVLATITPPVQGTGWTTTQLAYEQAKRDYERAERLREKQAISDRDFELIKNEYLALKSGFEALSGRGNAKALELKAPINGKIIEWQVRPGQRVNAGDKLMAIVDPETVWLSVNVYENNFYGMGNPIGVHVKSSNNNGGWFFSDDDIKVLTTGGALDPATRTIQVLLEISNNNERLKINEKTPVELYTSEGNYSTAIPKSAIYEENGFDIVFVQAGGESFEKRIVQRGSHYNKWVSILSGLNPGERVVSVGGYHVKLASTSAEIGHGHAH